MTSKIQTALRLALEAKRFRDLADTEVHRPRRRHWHPRPCAAHGAARWATRALPSYSAASSAGLVTSMGLSGPESLLEVKPGMSFLDRTPRRSGRASSA